MFNRNSHLDFLINFLKILDREQIEYVLISGTLLGAIRDKNFLPCDEKDTDIAIPDKYYWTVRYLLNKLVEQGEYDWSYIWRKEISILSKDKKHKMDMFFVEETEDKVYLYSYEPDPIAKSGKWTSEWRVWYHKQDFWPKKQIQFLGHKVYVPNNAENLFITQFGETWQVPDPSWDSTKPYNRDLAYESFNPAGFPATELNVQIKEYDFAYVCVNFFRKEETKRCVTTLRTQYPNCKIYMADQDKPSSEMMKFYEENEVEYYYLPFDSGLSYCRNFLIEKIKEPFIMWGDNDFVFDEKANIHKGIELLKAKEEIGIVGGCVLKNNKELHYERILMYDKKYGILVYIPLEITNPEAQILEDKTYYHCDLTFNYAIAKKEVFENKNIRWNEHVKVRFEHTDLFLKLKLFCPYQVVYFPEMKVHHVHLVKNDEYFEFRNRRTDAYAFAKYWNLKMNFTIGEGKEIYGEGIISEKQLSKQINQEQIPTTPLVYNKDNYSVFDILRILNNQNVDYIVIEDTCLDLIRNKQLILNPMVLSIAVYTEEDKNKTEKILKGIQTKIKVNIQLKPEDIVSTKYYKIPEQNVTFKVPLPAEKYLIAKYGANWRSYGK